MLRFLRVFRERGWTPIDAAAYAETWHRFGGSVATHPQIIERLAGLAGLPVRYLGWHRNGELIAAIPTWGRHLALHMHVLRHTEKGVLFDLCDAEVILPMAEQARISLRHQVRWLSELNRAQIVTREPQKAVLALARKPEELSKKFRYNHRREQRLLEEAGGVLRPMTDFSPAQQAALYDHLFQRRWAAEARGKGRLPEVFTLMREFRSRSVGF